MCLGLLAAGAVGSASAQNAIKAVASAMQQGVEVIQIDLARPLAAAPSSFSVASPARIALDFVGATNDVGRAAIEVNQPNLRSINVVQAGERSRVVLNLRQPVPYTAELQGNSVRVTLQAVAVAVATATATAVTETRTVETLAPADAAPAPVVRSSPITLNFSDADIEAVARTMAVVTGRNVVVDPRVKGTMDLVTDRPVQPAAAFNQFAAALRLQGFAVVEADGLYKVVLEANAKLQSVAVNTSIGAVPSSASNQVVTQIFRLNHESPNALMSVLRPLIPPNNTIHVSPGNNSLVITDYADNMRRLARIIAALDVPNASDVEVIQLKHSIATDLIPLVQRLIDGGASSAPNVSDAPGAADASFRTTLLADARSNSVLMRAANPARAQLVRTLIEKLDRPPAESSNGVAGNIYVVYLKNADAVRLAATLRAAMAANRPSGGTGAGTGDGSGAAPQQAAQNSMGGSNGQGGSAAANAPLNNANQPSTGGQIQADPSTNSLIITAPEPQYRQMRAVIDKLDGRRAQVMIEALIVEVSANKAANFGVQWQSALGNNAVIGTNSSLNRNNILALTQALATRNPAGLASSIQPGLNLGIVGKIGGQYILGAIANFFNSDGDANVLSTPNLLTLDNEEAKIIIGQNVPFPTGSYASTSGSVGVNPFTTVERKDVGLTLRVRPTINENGTVRMTIFQETSTVDQNSLANPNGPTTNKRSIESSVLVEDGGLVMLGGLLSDTYNNNIEKIPLAGDIPVLGNLFKNENRTRNKSNLMMFLRPAVMRDGASTETFAYDRYDEIRGQQLQVQPNTDSVMLRGVNAAPVLPEAALQRSNNRGNGSTRMEGTQLIPPPQPLADTRKLASSPLRGALPPTADPVSGRELP
ncbi:general secretion pathway protein D [Variovorax boronicumulans]|uniref:type II secretion system secretin GspD n=1 Tax=Variovorax boronicumulans TaxID=436515 RepID=UPI00277EF50D|nr:type II secretion system secretin GspD [Variovorax boronicumulans]MDP9991504.1 general secretion pathway protein D [Variovorax boronicumulans]MDQ0003132.1 general secretion pathway protein D [Variovorax boronicumulans]